ncbi:DEAD/DEAH box helicase [Dongia sp.]|uniref:DEAD/DEAH box helicase n=1 Tax=Dongia sp. TaxID=1977262 RepID=UPI0037514D6D
MTTTTHTHTHTQTTTNEIALFADLSLTAPLMQAVKESGYERPTPIQARAIPHLLQGRDLLGLAQTGTGKTAAFVLPMLQRLMETKKRAAPKSMRALILTPTRELAVQILESLKTYGRHLPLRSTQIFGGVGQHPQVEALRKGIDIVVATPGRLIDLIQQGHVKLESAEFFVLDEADRMLDMGFIRDIRRITPLLPKQRQTLLFSATMPNDVADLAKGLLKDPIRVEVVPQSTTAERIDQKLYFVARGHKRALLAQLLGAPEMTRAIVFTRTKHGANRLAEQLEKDGFGTAAIHGNKSQGARQQALNAFKNGKVKVLVATDIAARGIDVDGISHVVNYELPMEPEAYVHRIGRTARAGATGVALSFCDHEERGLLRDIERITRMKVPVVAEHPFVGVAEDPRNAPLEGDEIPMRHRGGNRGQRQGRPGQGARKAAHGGGGHRNGEARSNGGHRNGEARSGGRTQGAGASDSRNHGEARHSEGRGGHSHAGQHRQGQNRDGQSRQAQNRDGQNRNGQKRNGPARQGGHHAQTRHSDNRAGAKQR